MKTILLATLSVSCLMAQTSPNLQFEVAAVRPSQTSGPDRVNIGLHLDGAQVRISSLPLRDLIGMAYRVRQYQVSGPEWMTGEKFDVSAKLPDGSKTDQIPEMLQALLSDRFKLKFHHEQKELPVYAIMQGKPPLKIQPSAQEDAAAAPRGAVNISASGAPGGVSVDLGNGAFYSFADGKFEAKKFTMEMLARQLERYVDRPIVDMSGLSGTYDLTIMVTPEDARTMMIRAAVNTGVTLPSQALRLLDNASVASLLDGFQQLGLKLDARKAPLDILVVDQASKTVSDN